MCLSIHGPDVAGTFHHSCGSLAGWLSAGTCHSEAGALSISDLLAVTSAGFGGCPDQMQTKPFPVEFLTGIQESLC